MSTRQFRQDRLIWNEFCSLRLNYLMVLAETVEQGFIRRDTSHAAFCGCIDWHSSVHGAYALLTAAKLSGQSRWVEIVDDTLQPKCLVSELDAVRRGEVDHELPYGYAWFLKLALEREKSCGKTDLQCLAAELASRLSQWMLSLSDEEVRQFARRREYGNLSWALLNVWQWGKWKRDVKLLGQLSDFTRSCLLPLDQECPASLDREKKEFFPAALQRCRALLTILPPEDSFEWLNSHPYEGRELAPLTLFPTTHSAGLNFSRSWGLWALSQHTKNPDFRESYANHIVTHMGMPQYWRDDYRKYAHWVPQFGIYAIALSLEDEMI